MLLGLDGLAIIKGSGIQRLSLIRFWLRGDKFHGGVEQQDVVGCLQQAVPLATENGCLQEGSQSLRLKSCSLRNGYGRVKCKWAGALHSPLQRISSVNKNIKWNVGACLLTRRVFAVQSEASPSSLG